MRFLGGITTHNDRRNALWERLNFLFTLIGDVNL
jgi:hypothetical protein